MDIREEFEKLPEIRDALNEGVICFMSHSGWYESREFQGFECEQYVNGAWYAFREKQKQVDSLKEKLAQLEKWEEFHIEDYNLSESDSEHDRGWFNAACQVLKLLKEINHE